MRIILNDWSTITDYYYSIYLDLNMDLHCCDCKTALGTIDLPSNCHPIKIEVRCDTCNHDRKYDLAINMRNSNYVLTLDIYDMYDPNTTEYNVISFRGGELSELFLDVIATADLSTIKYIDISGGLKDGNLFFETLSKNKTLLNLVEINIQDRECDPETIDKFVNSLSFDGPIIREDSQYYQGEDVATIKIIHNSPVLKGCLNKLSESTHKILYGYKNAFNTKWKYDGDLAYVLLRGTYKERRW